MLVPSHPFPDSDVERLPAYSGATVPASHRLPAQNVESPLVRICAASLFALLWLASCAPRSPIQRTGGVVTLVPSFADDCYAVGAGQELAAVSAFTDDPRAAFLPRVADVSSVDAEAIVALRPRLVLGIPSQARFTEPLRRTGLRVVLLPDDTYESIFVNLRAIGALTGHATRGSAVAELLRARTAVLHRRVARFRWHPRVFVVLDGAPIWTAGSSSYIAELVALAGGRNAANDLHAAYGQYSAEALLAHQPDVLVADRAARLTAILGREPWRSLHAVMRHRVYEIDSDLLERPGPQYNEAIAWLLDRLMPIAMRPAS